MEGSIPKEEIKTVTTKREPLHRWDKIAVLKAFLIGCVLEGIAAPPLLLSHWGHAGPSTLGGWVGMLIHVPGFLLMGLLYNATGSRHVKENAFAYTCMLQALLITYVAFVFLRWRKRRKLKNRTAVP